MRVKLAACLVGLCLFSPGCSPLGHVARTIVIEPTEYSLRLDETVDCIRNKKLAKEAWASFQTTHPDTAYSCHYCSGFLDGYTDFLYAGGTGNPPPLPPRVYWRPEYQTPEGKQAVLDWFAGFREGAALAKQSGKRDLVTVTTSVKDSCCTPSQTHPSSVPGTVLGHDETAPVPRKDPVAIPKKSDE